MQLSDTELFTHSGPQADLLLPEAGGGHGHRRYAA